MYDSAQAPADPYDDGFIPNGASAPPPPAEAPRGRSRSRSPARDSTTNERYRSPAAAYSRPAPRKPSHAASAPTPSNVLGVFGLSIRTGERDLDEEFSRFGRVEKVTIVYDQRSDRSRGFGFIKMATVEDATKCIKELNGVELNGRRIRVDFSVTERPHAATPGEYMGHRRAARDPYNSGRDSRDSRDYRDRDRDYSRRDRHDRDRDHYGRDRDRDSDRDRDRDWRDRRSPARRHSPDHRRRRSYSRSPPRGGGGSPARNRDYDAAAPAAPAGEGRW